MHIDSSFVPLAPGKVLVNPDYVDPAKLPPMFNSWDILIAPRPDPSSPFGLALSSLTMQSLDQHKRAHARSEACRRRGQPEDPDQRVAELGIRTHSPPIPQLRSLWRILPLCHIGYPAPWRAGNLLLRSRRRCAPASHRSGAISLSKVSFVAKPTCFATIFPLRSMTKVVGIAVPPNSSMSLKFPITTG